MKLSFFRGRELLLNEIPKKQRKYLTSPKIKKQLAMDISKSKVSCLRCGTKSNKDQVRIVNSYSDFYYCPACIVLGRVQSNQYLYRLAPYPEQKQPQINLAWLGKLSLAQDLASQAIKQALLSKQKLLVHGVTGAGKTEMVFAAVLQALREGQRVCFASPRVDVCLEIAPRLAAAFPKVKISLLYGGQKAAYQYSQLVICTTHQLLRFNNAFSLIIVDEIDAFPFSDEPFLSYGVEKALSKAGRLIYLTATPSKALKKENRQGNLEIITVPGRYHRQKLPVPKVFWLGAYLKLINEGVLPKLLKQIVGEQVSNQQTTLIFCPTIPLMKKLEQLIKQTFPSVKLSSASAKDPERELKIKKLRQGGYQLFLSTTILERGVTFSGIDVIVVGSNHPVFNQGSLVQIAGRVGRSSLKPSGNVYFLHNGWSKSMVKAQKQIRYFNRLAQKEGIIDV